MGENDPISRRVFRRAFKLRDVRASELAHAFENREDHAGSGAYVSQLVLGGVDGIVTTFAVVAGVEGAGLSTGIILIMGVANIIADGFSMAAGYYLGTRSEQEYYKSERERETWEIEHMPDHERDEVRRIFEGKKLSGELLDRIVEHVTSDKELWLETMMRDELNMLGGQQNPLLGAFFTFLSFVAFGAVPLMVYIAAFFVGIEDSAGLFMYCIVATGLALFLVGTVKSRYTFRHWLRSGFDTLTIGGLAGALSYLVGYILSGIA